MRIAILDTETTGDEPGAAVVEYAHNLDGVWYASLVDPECTIPVTAMAVHQITNEMVHGAPLLGAVIEASGALSADVCVAHNAAFDRDKLTALEDKDWICTWKVSQHVWPDAPSHKLAALKFWLELVPPPVPGQAHRALYDVAITKSLFDELLLYRTLEDMIEISNRPVLLRMCRFGKHRDTPWVDVPKDYLRWILRNGDFDEDTIFTAKHWLDHVVPTVLIQDQSIRQSQDGEPIDQEKKTMPQSEVRGSIFHSGGITFSTGRISPSKREEPATSTHETDTLRREEF